MIYAHLESFCAEIEHKRSIFSEIEQKHSISAHFCCFCAVFAIGFCLGFNIGCWWKQFICFMRFIAFWF